MKKSVFELLYVIILFPFMLALILFWLLLGLLQVLAGGIALAWKYRGNGDDI